MLSNRKIFLEKLNTVFIKEPEYDENITKEVWQSISNKIKEGLYTCPIISIDEKLFLTLENQICYGSDDTMIEAIQEAKNRLVEDEQKHEEEYTEALVALKRLSKGFNPELKQQAVDIFKQLQQRKQQNDTHIQETYEFLNAVEENPIEYEGKGMPFEMLIVLMEITEQSNGTIGMLLLETAPDKWFMITLTRQLTHKIGYIVDEQRISGGMTDAQDPTVKAVDYLLNQRKNVIELEPTCMSLGKYMSIMPKKSRQTPQHLIYVGTKQNLIKRHPNMVSRILRKPVFAHMVKGHWRVLWGNQKQGKDRHGKPINNGYTWVVAHKRGKGELTEAPVYVVK